MEIFGGAIGALDANSILIEVGPTLSILFMRIRARSNVTKKDRFQLFCYKLVFNCYQCVE